MPWEHHFNNKNDDLITKIKDKYLILIRKVTKIPRNEDSFDGFNHFVSTRETKTKLADHQRS